MSAATSRRRAPMRRAFGSAAAAAGSRSASASSPPPSTPRAHTSTAGPTSDGNELDRGLRAEHAERDLHAREPPARSSHADGGRHALGADAERQRPCRRGEVDELLEEVGLDSCGPCSWYRSMRSVRSRRSEASTAARRWRGERSRSRVGARRHPMRRRLARAVCGVGGAGAAAGRRPPRPLLGRGRSRKTKPPFVATTTSSRRRSQRLAEHPLAGAVAVRVGGVEHRHAEVDRLLRRGGRRRRVGARRRWRCRG